MSIIRSNKYLLTYRNRCNHAFRMPVVELDLDGRVRHGAAQLVGGQNPVGAAFPLRAVRCIHRIKSGPEINQTSILGGIFNYDFETD